MEERFPTPERIWDIVSWTAVLPAMAPGRPTFKNDLG